MKDWNHSKVRPGEGHDLAISESIPSYPDASPNKPVFDIQTMVMTQFFDDQKAKSKYED